MNFFTSIEKLVSKAFNHPAQIAKEADSAIESAKIAVASVGGEVKDLESKISSVDGAGDIILSLLKTNGVSSEIVSSVGHAVVSILNATVTKHTANANS